MQDRTSTKSSPGINAKWPIAVILVSAGWIGYWLYFGGAGEELEDDFGSLIEYRPREDMDISGFADFSPFVGAWGPRASLAEVRDSFVGAAARGIEAMDRQLAVSNRPAYEHISSLLTKTLLLSFEGETDKAYEVLGRARLLVESDPLLAQSALHSVIYMQGVLGLRIGENDNCILCRGESSCILPISQAAMHTFPKGSRLAIKHFTEYLERFPNDLEVRWLLNIALMTLGEHPAQVDRRYVIPLDHYRNNEQGIGRFRDVGALVGVNRLNQAGGAIMDDFDSDGLLDLVTTTFDPAGSMTYYHNAGNGTFEDRAAAAGLEQQLGGLNCVQTDYNNDGHLDIFVVRGAWLSRQFAIRPSLLRNNGNRTFTDVTNEAGLDHPVNSIAATWADYDNDGWLDLFVCCEAQPNRLYRNLGDGTFEEVANRAGLRQDGAFACKGAAWIDYDNDGYSDLFLNHLSLEGARLYRNNKNGTFSDATAALGINGPALGFSCWAWDYDNDGWLDLFATCYDRSLEAVVQGLTGQPHRRHSNRLYRNRQGQGFDDVTKECGLDAVFATMGSNFGDFDNDGFLDMYLGTGEPNLATIIPNRMFKNIAGRSFAEITSSAGTGNLQKGHGVACGDWDRDGDVDIFIEMGGVTHGDRYHNILFQNPGHNHRWLRVKLVGQKSNRAAIGARIKIVTRPGGNGTDSFTVHRHITSGSSFGANPLEQTIGLGNAERIERLEIHWPTSGTTQVFRDLSVDQAIEVTEFAEKYRQLEFKQIPLPQ